MSIQHLDLQLNPPNISRVVGKQEEGQMQRRLTAGSRRVHEGQILRVGRILLYPSARRLELTQHLAPFVPTPDCSVFLGMCRCRSRFAAQIMPSRHICPGKDHSQCRNSLFSRCGGSLLSSGFALYHPSLRPCLRDLLSVLFSAKVNRLP